MTSYKSLSINVQKKSVACRLGSGNSSYPSQISDSEDAEDPDNQVTNIRVELKTAKVFHKVLNIIKSDDNLFQNEDFELLGEILSKILFGKRAGDLRNLIIKNIVSELKDENTLYRIFLDCTRDTDLNMMTLPWEYIKFKYKDDTGSSDDVISCFMAADLTSRLRFIRRISTNDENKLNKPSEEGEVLDVVVLFSGEENLDATPAIEERDKELESIKKLFEEIKTNNSNKFYYEIIENPAQASFHNDIMNCYKRLLKNHADKSSKFVIHYVGHSTLSDQRGKLVMKFPDGRANWMDDNEFAEAFKSGKDRPRPNLVVFQSCDSAKIGVINSRLTGLAASMASEKIEAVVGMQNEIDTPTSISFFKMFYQAILEGEDVGEAVTIGRHYLGQPKGSNYTYRDNSFGSPVLFITTDEPARLLKPSGAISESTEPELESSKKEQGNNSPSDRGNPKNPDLPYADSQYKKGTETAKSKDEKNKPLETDEKKSKNDKSTAAINVNERN
jgi:hypothetical protein